MKKLVAVPALAIAASLAVAALAFGARASSVSVSAKLTAKQEVPAQVVKNQSAHGSFEATLSGTHLAWTLTFAKLTGPATAAHIHLGGMGKAGNVVVPLCTPCKSPMKGTATISASLLKTIKKHGTYVNVHTAKNPNGEIRGQLVAKS